MVYRALQVFAAGVMIGSGLAIAESTLEGIYPWTVLLICIPTLAIGWMMIQESMRGLDRE